MNDVRNTVSYIFAISKTAYKGIIIWQQDDGYHIVSNGQEHKFDTFEQTTDYIDNCVSAVVVLN